MLDLLKVLSSLSCQQTVTSGFSTWFQKNAMHRLHVLNSAKMSQYGI
ncbi:hypothetical protein HC766_02050 [Candidatus Gracilibacteria bacterium]|nr:hypothetical protein [Candidatus Gracilibacteria bacterium]